MRIFHKKAVRPIGTMKKPGGGRRFRLQNGSAAGMVCFPEGMESRYVSFT